ncbi:DASS family sodium-coupled anion symporter [Gammaproteobacteria bacterium]|jgi:sodium-dependent dicarboxylate transporter 2/3/5|nr:DASS family sodium-coupled anion symporter [Gammaproteobacteria bacterium]|tara:strand:+ start:2753 stop:4189 length:1437 start_codon:yes stop_codon:yes gene_type:complete
MPAIQKKGFSIGLVLFFIMLFLPAPEGLSQAGWMVAAVGVLMATWWGTEALPVPVTALLPLALFPLLGVADFKTTALPFSNPNIYLFLGGFILALGIENSGLHKRLALKMIIKVGTSGARLVGGFMLVAALLSMWVMNTSVTLMLLPIGLAVCGVVSSTIPDISPQEKKSFDNALLIGIAYAATIGGMSTLIGTAPNIVFSAFMQETYGLTIGFIDWMKLGVPVAICMLFGAWYSLTKFIFPLNFTASLETKLKLKTMLVELGPMSKDESKVLIIFGLAAGSWIFRKALIQIDFLSGLTDAGIAIIAAILLFMTPSASRKGDLLSWDKTNKLPWGLLLLFGGGLTLAVQINDSGLGVWIGQGLMILSSVPPLLIIFCVATLIIFLTEITSNVATTSAFLPVIGAVAVAFDIAPISLTIPVVLAASCAFMLPVATPPNAIVYGSGKFDIATMMRAGFALNIIGMFVVTLFAYYLAPMIF